MARKRYKFSQDYIIQDLNSNNVNPFTRDVYIQASYEDEDNYIDWKCCTTFIKNLRLLDYDSDHTIVVHLNSLGGSWEDGMAMYDSIRSCRSYVVIVAYALVSSMSGVLLQAGDCRILMPNSCMMIHYGQLSLTETSKAAESYVEQNKFNSKKMIEMFTDRAVNGEHFVNKTREQIRNYIEKKLDEKHDWYLNPEEALKMGFCDGILGTKGFENFNTIRKLKV